MTTIDSQKQYERMIRSPIPRLVTSLAVPTVISQLITLVYNMVYLSSIKVTVWTIVGGVFLLVVLGTSLWSKYRSLTGTAKKIVTWVGALSLLPVLFICFVHFYFDVFSGLMQSYIFTMLTMMFVSDRIAEDWHAQQ